MYTMNFKHLWLCGVGHMVKGYSGNERQPAATYLWAILSDWLSFQPLLHNWYNKDCGMCYPVWNDAFKRSLAAN